MIYLNKLNSNEWPSISASRLEVGDSTLKCENTVDSMESNIGELVSYNY